MNHGPLIFLGLLLATAAPWLGLVFKAHVDVGRLDPVEIQETGARYPVTRPGLARMGEEVYRAEGCVHCHTRQVRPMTIGADIERGWGRRRSVAQDYLQDQPILPGTLRIGPDLVNIGARQTNQVWHFLHLYDSQIVAPRSIMPPYRYLFEVRPIRGEKSSLALTVPPEFAPKGFNAATQEIVPKQEAIALVEYLKHSQGEPYLYEAPPPFKPKKPGVPGGTNTVAGTNAIAGTNTVVGTNTVAGPQSSPAPAPTNAPAR